MCQVRRRGIPARSGRVPTRSGSVALRTSRRCESRRGKIAQALCTHCSGSQRGCSAEHGLDRLICIDPRRSRRRTRTACGLLIRARHLTQGREGCSQTRIGSVVSGGKTHGWSSAGFSSNRIATRTFGSCTAPNRARRFAPKYANRWCSVLFSTHGGGVRTCFNSARPPAGNGRARRSERSLFERFLGLFVCGADIQNGGVMKRVSVWMASAAASLLAVPAVAGEDVDSKLAEMQELVKGLQQKVDAQAEQLQQQGEQLKDAQRVVRADEQESKSGSVLVHRFDRSRWRCRSQLQLQHEHADGRRRRFRPERRSERLLPAVPPRRQHVPGRSGLVRPRQARDVGEPRRLPLRHLLRRDGQQLPAGGRRPPRQLATPPATTSSTRPTSSTWLRSPTST